MNRVGASENPILQVAGLVVGAVITVGAILVGAVVLSFIIGLAVVAGLILFARVWWLRRRMGRPQSRARGPEPGRRPGEIVEVEYTVVKERTVDERGTD